MLTRLNQIKIAVKYRNFGDFFHVCYIIIVVDRHWLKTKMFFRIRDENIAFWNINNFEFVSFVVSLIKQILRLKLITKCYHSVRKIVKNLIQIQTRISYEINSASFKIKTFLNFIINAITNFVIIFRNYNFSNLCNLFVIFKNSIEFSAKIIYEHVLNMIVIQYDISLVQNDIKNITFNNRKFKFENKTIIYEFNKNDSNFCAINTIVTNIEPLTNEYNSGLFYQSINVNVLHFEKNYICDIDVLIDDDKNIETLWFSFFFSQKTYVSVQIFLFMSTFEKLKQKILSQKCKMLEIEFAKIHKRDAQIFGVSKNASFSRNFAKIFVNISQKNYKKFFIKRIRSNCKNILQLKKINKSRRKWYLINNKK